MNCLAPLPVVSSPICNGVMGIRGYINLINDLQFINEMKNIFEK